MAAVAVNFTALNPSADGSLKADKNETTPNTTVTYLNWVAGSTQANSAVLAVGSDGKIQVMASSSTDMVIDVQGYYTDGNPAAGGYVPVTQARLVDTRDGTGLPQAKLSSNNTYTIQAGGLDGVPSDASAVMLNFLILNQSAGGWITPYPADGAKPLQSLSFASSGLDPTSASVALGSSGTSAGALKVFFNNSGGTSDLVVDVVGYFTAVGPGGAFTAAAARVYDSRTPTPDEVLTGGATRTIQIAGVAGVPADGLGAAAVNMLVLNPSGTAGGNLRAWPSGQTEPTPSMAMNYIAGETMSNMLTIALGADGAIQIHNTGTDTINVVLDIEGYFVRPPAATTYESTVGGFSITLDPTTDNATTSSSEDMVHTSVTTDGDPDAVAPDRTVDLGPMVASQQYAPGGMNASPPTNAEDTQYTGETAGADTNSQTSAGGFGYACSKSIESGGPHVISWSPWYGNIYSTHGWTQYAFFMYKINNARNTYDLGYTFQVNLCASGGSKSLNNWRLNRSGVAFTVTTNTPHIIGQIWHSGSVHSNSPLSLNFVAGASLAKISAGLSGIAANHVWTGGQGPSPIETPTVKLYPQNAVWAMWDGRDHPLPTNAQGSDYFEGTSALGLWEYSMQYPGNVVIQPSVYQSTNCPWYRSCA